MADSPAFDWICAQLEHASDLDRLEARGTIRIALKRAGLEAASVVPHQMRVVIEQILPAELAARGIEDGDAVCRRLAAGVASVSAGDGPEAPDAIFERLGRS